MMRYTLRITDTPHAASGGMRGLLLYEAPERALYTALEGNAPDLDAVVAAWCHQARQILKACQSAKATCELAEISSLQANPMDFAAHFEVPPPQTALPFQDPLRMQLARSLLPCFPDIEALAAQLTFHALPSLTLRPHSPADAPKAAVQAYFDLLSTGASASALHQQIALIQDQKNLLQTELETLERINQDNAEASRNRLAGKETALQTLGQKLRECQIQNTELQNALTYSRDTEYHIAKNKASKLYKALRFMWFRNPAQRDDRSC